ncbi:dienelactone hydrolase family protein [Mesorhizobium atlanticum]
MQRNSSPARDLAIRGWLAVVVIRRGYGRSDGSIPADGCKKPHVKQDLDLAADDLQAAIDVLKNRPDVDASRIVAIGGSTGGATAIALGARNPPSLVGVVSVSGGLRLNCAGWEDELLKAYKEYGATSHVPNLGFTPRMIAILDRIWRSICMAPSPKAVRLGFFRSRAI